MTGIEKVDVENLAAHLNFCETYPTPMQSTHKSFENWRMEIDDAPILRYVYRNFQPRRHLEFGTWQGFGAVLCLEECAATVWTINLLYGEGAEQQDFVYANYTAEAEALQRWAIRLGLPKQQFYRTDQLGFIGRHYLGRRFGHRVCQIYADSTKWDISNYPTGFFDSCLIDGGHQEDIVLSDTKKALSLVRKGGLIIWHDFSLDEAVIAASSVARSVNHAIESNLSFLYSNLESLFWVNPSMLLIGIKNQH